MTQHADNEANPRTGRLILVGLRYCVNHHGVANEDDETCDFSDHNDECEFRDLGYVAPLSMLGGRRVTSTPDTGGHPQMPMSRDGFMSMLGEGFHTAFRKASDSSASTRIWREINDLDPGEWSRILEFVTAGFEFSYDLTWASPNEQAGDR